MSKNKALKGYKLHKDRILFSGGTITRSIKYPLKPLDNNLKTEQLYQDFIKKIINDDLRIRGGVNLNDYLEILVKKEKPYTLFDFWLDSLRAGIIFMPKINHLINFLHRIYQIKSPAEKIWEKASEEIKKFFNKEEFIKRFILPVEIRKGKKTALSLKKDLIECLLEKYKRKEDKEVKVIDAEAEKIINFITDSFFQKERELLLDSREKQVSFWKKFNLNKDLLKESKPQGDLKDITCFIIPELIDLNEKDIENLINKRKQWLEEMGINDDSLKEILGITENFNAYSNYFGKFFRALIKEKKEEIYQTFFSIAPNIEKDKERVFGAIKFLSERAKNLGEPNLVLSWADYRSIFGGKIQSWYTNFENRDLKINEQKKKLQEGINQILEFFSSPKIENDFPSEIKDIKFFLGRLADFLEKINLNNQENFQIFEDLLSLIKIKINIFYLQNLVGEDNIPVTQYEVDGVKIFSPLYERIYKPVSFYGYAILKNNEKIVQKTIPIISDGIDTVFVLLDYLKQTFSFLKTFTTEKKKDETEEDSFRSLLEFFWNKYRENVINTHVFREQYGTILNSFIKSPGGVKDFVGKEEKYVFFKSKFAKGTQRVIALKEINFLEAEEALIKKLALYLLSFKKEELLKDPLLLIDFIELAKKIISLLLRFNKEQEFSLNRLHLDSFEKARNYLKTFDILKPSKKDFGYIINSLIFSEIKGAATIFSKKEYLAKYSAQVINSNKKFSLFLMFKNFKINPLFSKLSPLSPERKKYLNSPHIYLISPYGVEKDKRQKESEFLRLDKKETEFFPIKDSGEQFLLKISSSYYQTQFLDKYLFRPKGWENINIEMGEWSFIVEKKYTIGWDLEAKKPVIKETNSEKAKLFISIPFLISASPQKTSILKDISLARLEYPILGIDVGEYGLAWCLTKINEARMEILAQGFIEDKNIAAIKDNFSEIQKRAKMGIFNVSSDLVAEVRKNAIGKLRNNIHAILTSNKSSVVYEFSISNFETGSGRTTKIYNSIKKSDVPSDIDADNKQREHIWGTRYQFPGTHLSAYGSSYTCYKCKKSFFEIKKEELKEIIFRKKEGNILIFDSPYGRIYGFSEDNSYKEGERLQTSDKEFKKFKKIITDFARPPLRSEVLLKLKKYREEQLKPFVKRRGNSAIFVCPFCLNETDADIQAALIMAIRGYLNFQKKTLFKKDTSGEKIDWFKESLAFLRKTPVVGEIKLALKSN